MRIPRRTFPFLPLALLLLAGACERPQEAPLPALPERLEAARRQFGSPGLSAALVAGGKLVWSGGSGHADAENQVPATARSVYRIASISKAIAATAVMQLVERGQVALADPIQKYVPGFPEKPKGVVTIRHILNHTSGIRHYRDGEFHHAARYETIDEAIRIFRDDPLLFVPGEKYSYSTYAYNMLAGVVETASGLTFEEYLQRNVFSPAGMRFTCFDRAGRIIPHRVRQYVKNGGAIENAPYADLSIKWAGGGMLSTAEDLARFHIALNEGRLLRRETIEQTYRESVPAGRDGLRYGLGWQLYSDGHGHEWVAHAGGATGGTTYLLRNPRHDLAVILLANVQSAGGLRPVALEIAEDLLARAD